MTRQKPKIDIKGISLSVKGFKKDLTENKNNFISLQKVKIEPLHLNNFQV